MHTYTYILYIVIHLQDLEMSNEVWTDVLNREGAMDTTERDPLLIGSIHLAFNSVVSISALSETPLQARYSNLNINYAIAPHRCQYDY